MEETPKRTEKRFREIVDFLPAAVFETDLKGNIVFINRTGCKILGYLKKEVLGKSFLQFIVPENRSRGLQTSLNVMAGKFLGDNEFTVLKKDGTQMPVFVQSAPYTNDLGEVLGLRGIIIDITRRKSVEAELRESEQKYRSLINNIELGVFRGSLEGGGRYLEVNKAMEDIFGYTREELLSMEPVSHFVNPKERKEFLKKIVDSCETVHTENKFKRKDGREMWLAGSSTPVRDAEGKIIYVDTIMEDVTERKKAEVLLKESESKFRILTEYSPNMIFIINPGSRIVYVNKKCEELLGYTKREFYSPDFSFLNIIAPEFRDLILNNLKRRKQSEGVDPYEYSLISKDGRMIEAIVAMGAIEYENGKAFMGIVTDITERKKFEEKNRQLASIVEVSQDAIFGVSRQDVLITSWNIGAERVFGYKDSEIIGKPLYILIPPDRRHELDFVKMKIRQKESIDDFESIALKKGGERINVSLTICPILNAENQVTGTSIICRDVSEHKKAEEVIKNSEEKYRSLVNNLKVGVFRNTPEGRILECNKALEEITGYSRDELLNIKVADLYNDPDERKVIVNKIISHRKGTFEFYLKKKDKRQVLVSIILCTVTEQNDKILYFDGFMEDITDRKIAEELISNSEKKYRSLVNNIKLGIIRSTSLFGGRILESNKAFEEISGYSRDELLFIKMNDLFANHEESLQMMKEVKGEGRALTRESLWVRKDGIFIMVAITVNPIKDQNGEIIYMDSIVEDITVRKMAEEERKLADEKMRMLYRIEKAQREELQDESNARGMFISALAHELRTPLTPILNSTELLRDIIFKTQSDSIQGKLINNVVDSSQNLAHRLEELLDLGAASRGIFKLHMQPVKLRPLFEKIVITYKPVFERHQQQFIVDIPDEIPEAVMDPARINQVITNLLSNASKFSPEKSTITMLVKVEGSTLQVDVKDQGMGISAEDQEKLFKPYHRVEQDRQIYPGAGLGLAVCKEIIQAHQGKIWITSDGGRGSIFSFKIPIRQTEK